MSSHNKGFQGRKSKKDWIELTEETFAIKTKEQVRGRDPVKRSSTLVVPQNAKVADSRMIQGLND